MTNLLLQKIFRTHVFIKSYIKRDEGVVEK